MSHVLWLMAAGNPIEAIRHFVAEFFANGTLSVLVFLDWIDPIIHALLLLLLLGCLAYLIHSLWHRSSRGLLFFVAGLSVYAFNVLVFLVFDLETAWEITLLSVEMRRILGAILHISYPIATVLIVCGVISIARQNIVQSRKQE